MNEKELMWIRQKQSEFQELFGKKLIVDFISMIESVPYSEKLVEELAESYNVDLEKFRNTYTTQKFPENIRNFLIKLSKLVYQNKWRQVTVASFIGRDRTIFTHYVNYDNSVLRDKKNREYRLKNYKF
jgi:hypothetical protein